MTTGRPWLRWLRRAALGVGLSLAATYAGFWWQQHRASGEIRETIADLDAKDPGWRLKDIEASRRVVPDDRNGARVVMAVHALLPKKSDAPLLDEDLAESPPQCRFSAKAVVELRAELKSRRNALALEAARRMADLPTGRFAIEYAPDVLSTRIADQVNGRDVAQLLGMDACLAAEDEQPDQALTAVRGIFHVGRCYEDEPLLISQLIRIAMQSIGASRLERTLAQTVPSAESLVPMQSLLVEEAAASTFATGMRGERGGTHQSLEWLVEENPSVMQGMRKLTGEKSDSFALWDRIIDVRAKTMVYRSDTWLLRHHTKVLEAAKLPGEARYVAIHALEPDVRELTGYDMILAKLLVPATMKVADAERRTRNLLYCATVGCAAERFRLERKRWPADLDELVRAKFLDVVPEDLFDGQPLRLRRSPDGIVIHSVGKDGQYRGDALDRLDDFKQQDHRPEFRLWDVERRRQPPLPPKKDAIDEP
jgi:hypothetical protein